MRHKIINWLAHYGTIYNEDFIEIIYFDKDNQRITFDIDNNSISIITYNGSVVEDCELLKTDQDYEKAIKIFGI